MASLASVLRCGGTYFSVEGSGSFVLNLGFAVRTLQYLLGPPFGLCLDHGPSLYRGARASSTFLRQLLRLRRSQTATGPAESLQVRPPCRLGIVREGL